MVPQTIESLAKLIRRAKSLADKERYIGNNLKLIGTGGAYLKDEIVQPFIEAGIIIDHGYGMTETTGVGATAHIGYAPTKSLGIPYGGIELRIEDGEILMRGPSVMKGYYKDPEETAKVIVDGWLHTGDMGYCDEDGYYYITGRKKNVIILSNGENVNPEEIEAKFAECEAIEECMVYSDGKGICADVFAKDESCARGFIKAYNETMPLYRQVYKVNYSTEPLPKTGSGKIKRKENL